MKKTTDSAAIFIVDNSSENIDFLSRTLLDSGYRMHATTDVNEVVETAALFDPDLFLLGADLPAPGGYALCSALKKSKLLANIPVIFVGGQDAPVNKNRAFEVGGADYIDTPIDTVELKLRVKTHVELYRLQHYMHRFVDERTSELEGTLATIRILINEQKREAKKVEENILSNLNSLIIPLLDRLLKTRLDSEQKDITGILRNNIQKLTSPFTEDRNPLTKKLSPMELQIANLIKNGKKTKEIASILNLSTLTINTHRKNIRKKLDLLNQKTSLSTYLASLD